MSEFEQLANDESGTGTETKQEDTDTSDGDVATPKHVVVNEVPQNTYEDVRAEVRAFLSDHFTKQKEGGDAFVVTVRVETLHLDENGNFNYLQTRTSGPGSLTTEEVLYHDGTAQRYAAIDISEDKLYELNSAVASRRGDFGDYSAVEVHNPNIVVVLKRQETSATESTGEGESNFIVIYTTPEHLADMKAVIEAAKNSGTV